MTFSAALADRLAGALAAPFPADTLHWAKVSVLDTLGVAIAGARDTGVKILDRTVTGGGSGGPCVLVGTHRSAAPLDAALINGAAAHALDYDASNPVFAGHAATHLLAASLAAAELADADGAAFLAAYIQGFEAQSRIARACQPAHSEKGWFVSSTLGGFGAAAAAGLLLGLTPAQQANAFGLVAGMASGLLANSGSMAKPLSAGHSARNAILATLLARDGFTAAPDVFEHRFGFLRVFDIDDGFDPEAVLADWGRPWEVAITAVGIKQHPCCGTFHAAIDVLAALMAEHRLAADDVATVDVALMTDRLYHVDRPAPRTAVDAKFSAQYCLALTLAHGRPGIADFEPDAFPDTRATALMARVALRVHPGMRPDIPRTAQGGCRVTLTLAAGGTRVGEAPMPFGRVAGAPLPEALLHAKFLDCAGRALTRAGAERLLGLAGTLEGVGSMRTFAAAMRDAAADPSDPAAHQNNKNGRKP